MQTNIRVTAKCGYGEADRSLLLEDGDEYIAIERIPKNGPPVKVTMLVPTKLFELAKLDDFIHVVIKPGLGVLGILPEDEPCR